MAQAVKIHNHFNPLTPLRCDGLDSKDAHATQQPIACRLIAPDFRSGSKAPVSQGHRSRPNLGATRKSAGRFPTFVT